MNITCLRIELDGGTEYVIATNREWAHQYVANIHAEVIAEEPIEDVIERQFGGVAALTFLG
jgi:hypothetical protein